MGTKKRYVEKKVVSGTNFYEKIDSVKDNTIILENCQCATKYKSNTVRQLKKSDLYYIENVLSTKYLTRILAKAKTTTLSDENAIRFDQNPYYASYVELGNPDYWWLVLLVNKKRNVFEFTNFNGEIKLPDLDDIRECLISELTKNEDIGEVKEE